jgi:hypothetical protein
MSHLPFARLRHELVRGHPTSGSKASAGEIGVSIGGRTLSRVAGRSREYEKELTPSSLASPLASKSALSLPRSRRAGTRRPIGLENAV